MELPFFNLIPAIGNDKDEEDRGGLEGRNFMSSQIKFKNDGREPRRSHVQRP